MNIALILSRNYEGAEWTLNGDDYAGLTWLSEDIEKPTLEELEAQWAQVQYEAEFERVEKARQAAYQTQSDPVFFSYQRGEATEEDWLGAVQAVKDALPYPVAPEGGAE